MRMDLAPCAGLADSFCLEPLVLPCSEGDLLPWFPPPLSDRAAEGSLSPSFQSVAAMGSCPINVAHSFFSKGPLQPPSEAGEEGRLPGPAGALPLLCLPGRLQNHQSAGTSASRGERKGWWFDFFKLRCFSREAKCGFVNLSKSARKKPLCGLSKFPCLCCENAFLQARRCLAIAAPPFRPSEGPIS